MQFIAKSDDTRRHAVGGYRDKVYLPSAGLSGWRARTLCGQMLEGISSGETIATGIDCATCRRILRGNGWTF